MFLKDRTAAITGSTSGSGLAYARALAKEGANLVINGIMAPADAEKLRADLEQEFGVKVVFSPADMTKPAEIAGFIAEGEKAFGAIDILINNAGIQFVSPIDESSSSRRSTSSRSRNGTRSSRSTCPPPSTPSARRCRR